ncbi:MAG TPA: amino acid-binding protein [Gammaproteobacteria bacterium]|nr:amino acid-binding protein [Gammaproteobacteria bacterium]
MTQWHMLTIVGSDKPGIVAKITQALFAANCQLGEASMIRLGGNFTIMLMVSSQTQKSALEQVILPICRDFNLKFHLDPIENKLHDHPLADVLVTVCGADRPGIVAQVTQALFDCGMNILDLASDVAGSDKKPIYIMQIEGVTSNGVDALAQSVLPILSKDIDIQIKPTNTLVG